MILALEKLMDIEGGKQVKRQFQHAVLSATKGVNLNYKGL